MNLRAEWQDLLALHHSAIGEFAETAQKIPALEWNPPASEKWTPAHVTEHLALVYQVLIRELQGGPGMKLRTNAFVRLLLRLFFVPRLLRGDFPKGARAPRETRPVLAHAAEQRIAIESLQQLADRFHQQMQESYGQNPKLRLTHAYFGSASMKQSLLLCIRHIQHHTRQLKL
jgi:hypothetical protein